MRTSVRFEATKGGWKWVSKAGRTVKKAAVCTMCVRVQAIHVRDIHVQGMQDKALAGLGHVRVYGDSTHDQVGRLQLCAHF